MSPLWHFWTLVSPAVIHCSHFIFFTPQEWAFSQPTLLTFPPAVAAGQLFPGVPGVSLEQRGRRIFFCEDGKMDYRF